MPEVHELSPVALQHANRFIKIIYDVLWSVYRTDEHQERDAGNGMDLLLGRQYVESALYGAAMAVEERLQPLCLVEPGGPDYMDPDAGETP